MSSGLEWAPLRVNYDNERAKITATTQPATTHPLQKSSTTKSGTINHETNSNNLTVVTSTLAASTIVELDPLSALSDPLSSGSLLGPLGNNHTTTSISIPTPTTTSSNATSSSVRKNLLIDAERTTRSLWQVKKDQILSDYTVSGVLTLSTAAMEQFTGIGSVGNDESGVKKVLDKYSQRLATLETRGNNKNSKTQAAVAATVELTQKEYEANVARLSRELTKAWNNDERVASLKIVIQLSKLLGDTHMPQFYPAMFVIVSTELERFGDMVFTRLRDKAEEGIREGLLTSNRANTPAHCFLSENFRASDIPASAKEVCRNWFYKTACIRELLPRVFIEISLLRSYRFLSDTDYPHILNRLAGAIRGMGDPLVSLYARAYLVMVGRDVAPSAIAHVIASAKDTIYGFTMLREPFHAEELVRTKVSAREYLRLMSPGIEWMLRCLGDHCAALESGSITNYQPSSSSIDANIDHANNSPFNDATMTLASSLTGKEIFQEILTSYREHCSDNMVLALIIGCFSASYYAQSVLGMVTLIKAPAIATQQPESSSSSSSSSSVQSDVCTDTFAVLGRRLLDHLPADPAQKKALLSAVWKHVVKTEDLHAYIRCVAAWLELTQRHYSSREILILLADLSSKLTNYMSTGLMQGLPNGSTGLGSANTTDIPEPVQRQLASILETLLGNCAPAPCHQLSSLNGRLAYKGQMMIDRENSSSSTSTNNNTMDQEESLWNTIMTSEHLPKILDAFRGQKKASVCKELLELFKHHPPTSDTILINALFDIGKAIHDAIDSLTAEGDRKQSASLLCLFIQKIDCGRNLEQQLHLYVECRARFCNLDSVKTCLILCVCSLCARAHRWMKGKHNKKTGAFVKAALAYCHITVPSLQDPFKRLQLLLHCAEIALLNQCLPQTDTFLKAAIHLLPDLPATDADSTSTDSSNPSVDKESGGSSGGGRKGNHTEERLAGHLRVLLSLLVVAPGHPSLGPFYILNGLLNALPKYPWQPTSGVQTRIYIDLLALLCALSQRSVPYHVPFVDSNDELFGGSAEYVSELGELLNTCMTEILKQLNGLGNYVPVSSEQGGSLSNASAAAATATAKLSQIRCVLHLVNQLGARFELASPAVAAFVVKLLELVQQTITANTTSSNNNVVARNVGLTKADQKHFTNTLLYLKTRATMAPAGHGSSTGVTMINQSNVSVPADFLTKITAMLSTPS